MKGSEFLQQMANVDGPARDQAALKAMLAGNTPSFMESLVECRTGAVIDGLFYECVYRVRPGYLAIGTDEDFVTWPLTEPSLQAYYDAGGNHWYIPPGKLVFETWRQSAVKIPTLAVRRPGAAGSHPGTGTWTIDAMQKQVNAALAKLGAPLTAFVRAKKAYSARPGLDGAKLCFSGWFSPGPPLQPNPYGWSWQGLDDMPHEAAFTDYSHGCDGVYYAVQVNGQQMDFADVCQDPKLHVLVSARGPFNPHFPNSGSGAPKPKAPTVVAVAGAPVPNGFQGPIFKTNAAGGLDVVRADNIPTQAASNRGGSALGVIAIGAAVSFVAGLALKRLAFHPT
jgi:hypothetical protein